MARIRADYVFGTTDTAINATATTLSSPALARLPVVTAPDVAAITLHDTATGTYEIVHVTAHTAAATTATIVRAREGSTAAAWGSGASWVHGPTAADAPGEFDWSYEPHTRRGVGATTAGTWIIFQGDTLATGGIYYNSSNSNTDLLSIPVWLSEGSYTLTVIGSADPTRAIQTWDIDDGAGAFTTIGTADFYSAATVENTVKTLSFTITGGLKRRTLRVRPLTRHASATGWYAAMSVIQVQRTA